MMNLNTADLPPITPAALAAEVRRRARLAARIAARHRLAQHDNETPIVRRLAARNARAYLRARRNWFQRLVRRVTGRK